MSLITNIIIDMEKCWGLSSYDRYEMMCNYTKNRKDIVLCQKVREIRKELLKMMNI